MAFHWNAPKHFYQYISFSIPPIFFHLVNVSGIDISLKFTYLYHCYLHLKIFRWLYLSSYWCFLLHVLFGNLPREMLYLSHTYHISSVYFSEVQESIICVVHRNQILSDVKYSNHIVTSTGMAIRIQLQYCDFLSI